MSRKPRIRIINHRASDEEAVAGNLPWERQQALNEAVSQIKRAVALVPSTIGTTNQMSIAKRAMGTVKQEVEIAIKLLLEKA
jgi:hypothetical protein